MKGYRLFRRNKEGRGGGGVALCVREQFDCTTLTVSDDVVLNKDKRGGNKDVVGIYYQSPSQEVSIDELFYRQSG